MSLLDKSIELYLGVKAAKPMTDPMFMQIKDFIVNHFGHEGTRAIAAADEQQIVFTYKQGGEGYRRTMRAFEHPLNVAKRTAPVVEELPINADDNALAKLQNQYAAVCEKFAQLKPAEYGGDKERKLLDEAIAIRLKINAVKPVNPQITPAVTTGNMTKSPELAAKTQRDAAKSATPGKQNSPARSQTQTPVVAAGDATPGGTTNDTRVEIDATKAKTMRARTLGELYTPEVMQWYLKGANVELSGKESRTQLAALILQHINPKPE